MEISPSDLDLPDHADEDEAAAIAAAISAYLSALETAAEEDGGGGWQGRKWSFAGRLDALFQQPRRVRDGTPTDAWTAAGRRDRL